MARLSPKSLCQLYLLSMALMGLPSSTFPDTALVKVPLTYPPNYSPGHRSASFQSLLKMQVNSKASIWLKTRSRFCIRRHLHQKESFPRILGPNYPCLQVGSVSQKHPASGSWRSLIYTLFSSPMLEAVH